MSGSRSPANHSQTYIGTYACPYIFIPLYHMTSESTCGHLRQCIGARVGEASKVSSGEGNKWKKRFYNPVGLGWQILHIYEFHRKSLGYCNGISLVVLPNLTTKK